MLKIKSFFYPVLLFLSLSFGCAAKASAQNNISGEIKNLPSGGTLKLVLEEDINRRKSRVVAEIPVDEAGRFRYEKELSPHIYSLKLTEKLETLFSAKK